MPPKDKQNARALLPLPDIIDPPDRLCVQIRIPNETGHRQAFIGQIYQLTRWYNWERDETKAGREVAMVWAAVFQEMIESFYNDQCGEIMTYQLRQNPTNPCLLEQSVDGVLWSPAFDYSLCKSDVTSIRNVQNAIYREQIAAQYPPGTDPPLPDNWDSNTGGTPEENNLIEQALCYAVASYIDAIALDLLNRARIAGLVGGAAAAGSILAIIASGGILAVVAPFVGTLAASGIAISDAARFEAAITNSEIIQEIGCCMLANLRGAAASETTFAASLTSCPDLSTEAAWLKQYFEPYMSDRGNFLLFARFANDAQQYMSPSVDLCFDCNTSWCVVYDFAIDDYDFVGRGVYASGQGWNGEDYYDSNPTRANRAVFISKAITPTPTTITEIELFYTLTKGSYSNVGLDAIVIQIDGTTRADRNFNVTVNGSASLKWTGSLTGSSVGLFARSSLDANAPFTFGGSIRVTKAIVKGVGTKPTGVPDCP